MSRMIPQATVDALRQFNDVTLDNYGVACTLYLLNNPTEVSQKDAYAEESDKSFTAYPTVVFVDWNPKRAQLRKLGAFNEDFLPILAWFKNIYITSNASEETPPLLEITIGSYITFQTQYIPDKYDTDEFSIVDIYLGPTHDAQIVRTYALAPRRHKA